MSKQPDGPGHAFGRARVSVDSVPNPSLPVRDISPSDGHTTAFQHPGPFDVIEMLGPDAEWQELQRGGTAGRAFVGAFEAPKDVPLTFAFAPITTRYLRLRLLANDDTYYWSVAELKVLGD